MSDSRLFVAALAGGVATAAVEVLAWDRAEPIVRLVDWGGDFITRTCMFCRHTWSQREETT